MTRAILQTNGSVQMKAIFFKLHSTRYTSHHHTSLPYYRTARFSHLWFLNPSPKSFSTVSTTALQFAVNVPIGETSAILTPRQDDPWVEGMTVRCLLSHSSPDPSGLNQIGQEICHSQSSSPKFSLRVFA